MSPAPVPGGSSDLTTSQLSPSVLGLQSIRRTPTLVGAQGPPASQLPPLLLVSVSPQPPNLPGLKSGCLRFITWASTFSTLWQSLDF